VKFEAATPPIGSKVCFVTGKLTPDEIYTVVENDEYLMAELLVVEDYRGRRRECTGSEVAYVSPDDIIVIPKNSLTPKAVEELLEKLLDQRATPDDAEGWAFQDGWNGALAQAKINLAELVSEK